MRPLWVGNRKELPVFAEQIAQRHGGKMPPGAFGILNGYAKRYLDDGDDFVYFDHAYFKRGWQESNFRAIRNGLHLTKMLDRPKDRLDKWGVKIEPWRKSGTEIVIIPPSDAQKAVYGCDDWLIGIEAKLAEITDRPVTCKASKNSALRDFLVDAWAVVTFASVAGVEAALMGVPVFSTERCPSWPICAGPLERIDTPEYSDARAEWAASLTYATWNWDEMERVRWEDYNYEINP